MNPSTLDIIQYETVGTLAGLFRERVKRSPNSVAYKYFDKHKQKWLQLTWEESAIRVAQIQAALASEGLRVGDKVAIMLRNCPEWVEFEQAALGLGLVVVPLYTNDRADNVSYVLQDAGVKVLLIEGKEQLIALEPITAQLSGLTRLITLDKTESTIRNARILWFEDWVNNSIQTYENHQPDLQTHSADTNDLATIVYTSGTTGRPKGVMLSHRNILFNTNSGIQAINVFQEDLFLSFLPLSHMLERMAGYYIPMMCGASVAFARSVQDLAEDLLSVQPTILISVPRIYERVYAKMSVQLAAKSGFARGLFKKAVELGWERFNHPGNTYLFWPVLKALVAKKIMAKLGGRIRVAICGGAPLSTDVAKTFIGLGLNLLQGYGLTETSPVISVNRMDNNDPASVGPALEGVEIMIGENDELLTRSPCVMLGYWNNPNATKDMIDKDGWLHTGDKAKIENGRVYITGRLKEIIVMSTGKKVPPADMEMAITIDDLVDQAIIVGEAKPYLSAILVINPEQWEKVGGQFGVDPKDPDSLLATDVNEAILNRVNERTKKFPGFAQIKRVALTLEPWTVENGLITPTLKLKREQILDYHEIDVIKMYEGH